MWEDSEPLSRGSRGSPTNGSPAAAPTLLQARRLCRKPSDEHEKEVVVAAPASTGVVSDPGVPGFQGARTTVMLRNIPNNYTRTCLLDLLDKRGLSRLYDFVYLPVDFRTGAALGYAFVNVVDPVYVPRLWSALDKLSHWGLPSRKRCSVTWSHPYQGFEENVERYRNSPIMHCSIPDSHKPIIFEGGSRVPYPPPTKPIKAPRIR